MPLILVTGPSGAGKSTLTHILRERRYDAYDTDDDGLARWQNNETGYFHPKSSVTTEMRTTEFITSHSWNVPREFIEEIADENKDKIVFILGTSANYEDLKDLFSRVIALDLDDETMTFRLKNRTNNDWGKQPHELQQTLDALERDRRQWHKLGWTIINADQPIEDVATKIIAAASSDLQ